MQYLFKKGDFLFLFLVFATCTGTIFTPWLPRKLLLLFLKEQNVQNNLPSSIRALFLMAILYSGVSAIAATCKVMQRCVKEFSCSYILLYFLFLYSFVSLQCFSHIFILWACKFDVREGIGQEEHVYVEVNFYFQLNFTFPLFWCMLMYGNVHKHKGKQKFNWKKN